MNVFDLYQKLIENYSSYVSSFIYTGQENEEERKHIINNPPDILITNYVMLEMILTRIRDRSLIKAAHLLQFLVFDELHTYKGAPGCRCGNAHTALKRLLQYRFIKIYRHFSYNDHWRCI